MEENNIDLEKWMKTHVDGFLCDYERPDVLEKCEIRLEHLREKSEDSENLKISMDTEPDPKIKKWE